MGEPPLDFLLRRECKLWAVRRRDTRGGVCWGLCGAATTSKPNRASLWGTGVSLYLSGADYSDELWVLSHYCLKLCDAPSALCRDKQCFPDICTLAQNNFRRQSYERHRRRGRSEMFFWGKISRLFFFFQSVEFKGWVNSLTCETEVGSSILVTHLTSPCFTSSPRLLQCCLKQLPNKMYMVVDC